MPLQRYTAQFLRGTVLLFFISTAFAFVPVPSIVAQASENTSGAEVPLIPRHVLFGNPTKTNPQLSPDGTYLAYVAPEAGVLNLWVRTIGQADDRAITHDRHRGLRYYFWAQDSQQLLYVSDKDGDENFLLYSVNLATGETRCLTPFDKVQVQIVKVDKNFPNEILIAINKRKPTVHDIYRLNLKTGDLELAAEPPGNVRFWIVDPRLRVRGVHLARPDAGFDLLVRDTEDSAWRKVVAWDMEDALTSRPVSFSKDGRLLYLLDSRGAETGRLVALDLTSGQTEVLAADPQYDLGTVFGVAALVDPDMYEIQAISYFKERRAWILLDEALRGDFAVLENLAQGDFFITSRSADDQTWLVKYETDTGSPSYYVYDRKMKQGRVLFKTHPALDRYRLAEVEPITFTARDGLTIHGYITFPPGKERKQLPLVVEPHGGPWYRDTWGYKDRVQWFANRGYICLQVNFRGSTGYGKAFIKAADKEWGRKMLYDVLDGVQWAVEQGYADPKRLGIYGGSFGGYQTLCAAAFAPDRFRCAIDIMGPSNLVTFMKSFPPQWESRKARFHKRGGDPYTEAELLKSRSPYFYADRITIPMLIAQGANDPRVKRYESDQIVQKLKENGVEHEYLVFADEGHGLVRPENRETFFAAVERFLAKHLGGRTEER